MTKNELAREVSVSEKLHLSTTVKAIDGTLRVIKEAHTSVKLRASKELVKAINEGKEAAL